MEKRLKTLLIAFEFIFAIIFATYMISPLEVQAQITPKITIEPSYYQAQKIGETFNVTVKLHNIETTDRVVSVQFRVIYDKNLLEALSVTEGPFMKQFGNTVAPPYTFFMSFIEEDVVYGQYVLVGIVLLPNGTGCWTNFPEGNGTLATITFKTTYRPIEPATATCSLNLENTMIVDDDLQEINHTTTDATYEALPIPQPSLNVEPSTYTASLIGEVFKINIDIKNLDSDIKFEGVQFRVKYNDSILEASSVTEGPFMKQFGNTVAPPYTFFMSFIEDDVVYGPHVLVGIVLLPNGTGCWTNFPEGNGTLATITFKAITQTGEPQLPDSSMLILNNTMLVNSTINEILHTFVDGYYEMEPLSFTYEPSIPLAGQPVFFEAPEANHTVTYCWNFGDGTSLNVTESTVGHIYTAPGEYDVSLTCITDSLTSSVSKPITIWSHKPSIETTVDVGSIHFRGEITEFNILNTNYGEAINVTKTEALLYHDSVIYANLTSSVQHVDTGFYIIPYNVPADAETGTYTLIVKAEYYNAKGTSMKSFQISQTLTNWANSITAIEDGIATIQIDMNNVKLNLTAINAALTDVQGNIAIIRTTIGTLQTELSNINATLTGIIVNSKDELLAKIDTNLGTIQTDIKNINATITEIKGNTATISTTLGEVETNLGNVQGTATTTLYAASILSAIAIILAAVILMILKRS